MRDIPIFTFINKMDREARDPYELMQEIEQVLGIATYPINWPIGSGKDFKGVYEREKGRVLSFSYNGIGHEAAANEAGLDDPALENTLGSALYRTLQDDVELLDGAGGDFDLDLVRHGKLSPVFFGSALSNFGVEPFL